MESLEKLLESCEVSVKVTGPVAEVVDEPKIDASLDEAIKAYCEADRESKKFEERKKKLKEQILAKVGAIDKSQTVSSSNRSAAIRVDVKHKYSLNEKKLEEADSIRACYSDHPFITAHCQLEFNPYVKDKLIGLLEGTALSYLTDSIETKFELKETGAKLTKLLSESRNYPAAIQDTKSYQLTVLDVDSE